MEAFKAILIALFVFISFSFGVYGITLIAEVSTIEMYIVSGMGVVISMILSAWLID